MLENKVIIYDDSCPLCKLYTYWFVAWGFLRPENRIGFAAAPPALTSHLDVARGRHEIPLFDRATHETIYGLSALTFILGSRWAWLNPLFKSKLFFWFFFPLYQIITYNRRVIAGCKACHGFDCAPDLNRFYRSIYLVLVGTSIGIVVWTLIQAGITFAIPAVAMIAGFTVMGIVAGTIMWITRESTSAWDYFGNYVTSMGLVAIALLPLLIWPNMAEPLVWTNLFFALLLGLEELRRREL